MHVIALLNPKGGSGKSTLAACLTAGLAEAGNRVLAVDTDPQGTLADWQATQVEGASNQSVPLIQLERPNNLRTLQDLAAAYDVAVIDGAGRTEGLTGALIRIADLVLIPAQPSAFDLWATNDLVAAIQDRQELTGGQPQAAFVVSRAVVGSRLGKEVTDAVTELGLPLFRARIHQRQAYPRATGEGQTPLSGNDASAKSEIRGMAQEVLATLRENG